MTRSLVQVSTRLLFVLLNFALVLIADAQGTTRPDPQNRYGEGTTITTTKSSDQTGTETTVEEYKDRHGTVKSRKIRKQNIQGEITDSTAEYTPGGRLLHFRVDRYNKDGYWIYTESQDSISSNGTPKHWRRSTFTRYPDGSFDRHELDFIKKTQTTTHVKSADPPPANTQPSSVDPGLGCVPRTQGYVGYSFLNVGYGGKRESFPLGINASFNYNFKSSFGAIVDLSYHTKTEDDYSYSNMYFGIGVQYNAGAEDCDQEVHLFGNLLVGVLYDRFSYNGEKLGDQVSISGLLGGGVNIGIGKRTGIKVQAHYVPVFNDGIHHGVRAGAGLYHSFSQ